MIWADGTTMERLQGLGPVAKLLVIPLLLYHFERSERANWVFVAFGVSCTLLLVYSFVIFAFPAWQFTKAHGFDTTGVPIRNAIDQNQEFALCGFGLSAMAVAAYRRHEIAISIAAGMLAALFFTNILFVALARTSLIFFGVLAVLFAAWHFPGRRLLQVVLLLIAGTALVWLSSPYLRGRVEHIMIEYREYRETHRPTSAGQRLEYWASAITWISEAPLLGHGTGSAKTLFNAVAVGKEGAWGDKIGNPHNQTLYVAIQWGMLGCFALYLMWWLHYRLFNPGSLIAWFGVLVVVQNVTSSLLNSHLFDFAEGWIYVVGVGVAGGATLRKAANST
jgi:O-antigen ligase